MPSLFPHFPPGTTFPAPSTGKISSRLYFPRCTYFPALTQFKLTVVCGLHSFSRFQNSNSQSVSLVFCQPTAARENDRFLVWRCDFDFLHENTMARSTTFISKTDFLDLKTQKSFVTSLHTLQITLYSPVIVKS